MSQPPNQPALPGAAPGWYPDPTMPGMSRWWNGTEWGQAMPAAQVMPSPAPYAQQQQPPRSVSIGGMTYGQHLLHAILSVCTLGAWIPVWIVLALLGRRKVVMR
jgi:hypothetical protein